MEVAVGLTAELRGVALQTVGLDMAAERNFHGVAPDEMRLGAPPRGWWLKAQWLQEDSETSLAKILQPFDLRTNIRF